MSSSTYNKSRVVFHQQKLSSSSIKKTEVVFHLQSNWGRLPFTQKWGLLPLAKKWGRLPFTKKWGLLPLAKKWGRLPFTNKWGRLPVAKKWGRLPFTKQLRSSSIYQEGEVVFHTYICMLESQFIWIWQFGYFSGLRRMGGRREHW